MGKAHYKEDNHQNWATQGRGTCSVLYVVFTFKKSSKLYCVYTAKVIKLKDVLKGSNLAHGDQFSDIFQILIFQWLAPKNKIWEKLDQSCSYVIFSKVLTKLTLFWLLFILDFLARNLVLGNLTAISFLAKLALTLATTIYTKMCKWWLHST